MKIKVTQTLIYIVTIEVPDDVGADSEKLKKAWCDAVCVPSSVDELEWVGTNFVNAETDEELCDI